MFSLVILQLFFFFKQKTAYEMRISDWSSDVCSSDLDHRPRRDDGKAEGGGARAQDGAQQRQVPERQSLWSTESELGHGSTQPDLGVEEHVSDVADELGADRHGESEECECLDHVDVAEESGLQQQRHNTEIGRAHV